MMNFLKNKSIGYYITAGIALISLILAIIFFATYNNPALRDANNVLPMGNKASGLAPETIGIFLLAGVAVEVALLVIPQFRFIHLIAVVMFSLALYKEVIIIPDFIAGKANNVEYNGGNFGLNMFFLVTLLIIVISSVVVSFLGFYKDEKQAVAEMSVETKNVNKLVRLGAAGALVLVAVLAGSLISSNVIKQNGAGKNTDTSSVETSSEPIEPIEAFDPITPEIAAICDAYEYDFDPMNVLFKEEETWDYSDSELVSLSASASSRSGHNLVYYFEGSYAEGYQGDYSETYGYLYLWDDGLFNGTVNSTSMKGFWYNSSIAEGTKVVEEKDEEGNVISSQIVDYADCLNMVSQTSKYESIITSPSSGFYERAAYVYLGFSWGTRSMILNGYRYYPEVALAIDPSSTGLEFKVGDTFDRSGWVADRILKNKNYSAVFKSSEVTWTDEAGMLQNGKFTAAGEYTVKAKWKSFEAEVTVKVTEPEPEPAPAR